MPPSYRIIDDVIEVLTRRRYNRDKPCRQNQLRANVTDFISKNRHSIELSGKLPAI